MVLSFLDLTIGNSPSQIKDVDFTNKTVIHTTSCGTQGIVKSINADEIITGSFVNSKAIIKYIKRKQFNEVSFLALSKPGEKPFEEDQLFAEFMKANLEGNILENFEERKANLKYTSGAKFFNKELNEIFPEDDYYLCLEMNKFDFVLKAVKQIDDTFEIVKIKD